MDNPNDSPRWITAAEAYENLGGGGTPGGDDTQVQYNDDGAFAGSADFVWDNNKGILSLGTSGADGAIIDSFLNKIFLHGTRLALSSPTASNQHIINLGDPDNSAGVVVDLDGEVQINNLTAGGVTFNINGGRVAISGGALLLAPTTEPESPEEGMIYAGTDHHIYYYNGTTWKQLDNTL